MIKKLSKLLVLGTLSVVLATTSFAATAIHGEEVESNNTPDTANIIEFGDVNLARISSTNDTDCFKFTTYDFNKKEWIKDVNFLLLRQSSDNNGNYFYMIYDQTTHKYVQQVTEVTSNVARLNFQAEEAHIYVLTVVKDNEASVKPYQFMFY